MNKKIYPCPECGGEPVYVIRRAKNLPPTYGYYCDKCHIETDMYFSKESALDAWNREVYREYGSEVQTV